MLSPVELQLKRERREARRKIIRQRRRRSQLNPSQNNLIRVEIPSPMPQMVEPAAPSKIRIWDRVKGKVGRFFGRRTGGA